MRQFEFQKIHWKHRYSHGGDLRRVRAGRKFRPLSSKDPIHLVFKANRERIHRGFRTGDRYQLILEIMRRYSFKFFVKVEQFSIQGDHIHLLIRTTRRTNFQSFFRVFAGQIAQEFENQNLVTDTPESKGGGKKMSRKNKGVKLWKHRPFTRVVKGWRAYKRVEDYIQLNEKEARGEIAYNKQRLRGLNEVEWQALWA